MIEEGDKVIGDKLYGMDVELLSYLLERKITPVIAIREGVHNKVRNEVRIEVRKIYHCEESEYKNRYKIEQSIGNIKNAYGSYINVKRLEIAEKMVLACFLAYNIVEYLRILNCNNPRPKRKKVIVFLFLNFRVIVSYT